MKDFKIALLGFGNAGRAFVEMLLEKKSQIIETYNLNPIIVAISTKSKGILLNEKGIDLPQALYDAKNLGKFQSPELAADLEAAKELTSLKIAQEVDYDALVEMTPLNIMTGQPAISHIEEALKRGKNVVTANKGPIAWDFARLKDLAEKNNCGFFYETTVMDGAPVFNMAKHTLKLCKITEVSGILNTTTNYILEEMAKGIDYDQIIEAGRREGFVEADLDMDLKGYDAAAKTTALLNVLMNANITPDKVARKGIEDITYDDVNAAAAEGKVYKLLCMGKIDSQGQVIASVEPVLVEKGDVLATVTGTTSLVSITTDLMGKISIVEHDPKIQQTAYGVFGDTLNAIEFFLSR